MRKPKIISSLIREISFTAITWKPESNCTCRKKNHFSISLKYIDVTRTTHTHTSLDVLLKKQIDARASQDLFYWVKGHPMDIHGPRFVEAYVWCIKTRRKAKVGCRETKARWCQKIAWCLLHWTWWWRIVIRIMKNARRELEIPMQQWKKKRKLREIWHGSWQRSET